ncbi:MAG: DNA-directed RNA polymerase subunit beta [Patescibacteria group bacterium]|nr:DNA-directed RNA polymerase subunit beta [Patescibacteria group bacterium]
MRSIKKIKNKKTITSSKFSNEVNKFPPRKYFTTNHEVMELPNLIEIQTKSYDWFVSEGLRELFDEISPIKDYSGKELELYLKDYYLDEPKYDELTAKSRNTTFESPLRCQVELVNKKTGEIKEQEIYLGDFPLMTPRGTFIINGVERVVVSQLIRSPGVFFTAEFNGERRLFGAKVIPNRGAWLEFETDSQGVIAVKIDRKRKVPVTSLLRAFGYTTNEEIKSLFKEVDAHPDLSYIQVTISKDHATNQEEGLKEVYKRIRPGDLATADNARSLIYAMFFNFDRYDFGRVGRYKMNKRLGLNAPISKEGRVLQKEDLVAIIREIIRLNNTQGELDEIDHLGNRRVRAVGELIQNRFRVGLARMERIVHDRMSTMDLSVITPSQLINARPVIAAVREFFMSSQLSQFMDQTNPLAELEHKRRLSAMGPGGLHRKRAGFDVRDVHRSHYGRICPIATPEGPNIGLVGHLASYARLNEYGFIETPYRKVVREVENKSGETSGEIARGTFQDKKGRIIVRDGEEITLKAAREIAKMPLEKITVKPHLTNEIVYLDAFTEEATVTVPATVNLDAKGYFLEHNVRCRVQGEPTIRSSEKIDYVDVSPRQIVSITTSLIPFLEHDDASRALMGTNMQRQSVSCIIPEAPIVGTGTESAAALYSGQVVVAQSEGKVIEVSSDQIKLLTEGGEIENYPLLKFDRSNASTCMNQRPLANKGQRVKKGDVLADGAATDHGELALGQNLLVAFMAWEGGNFEDAILISDRVVQTDRYSSIHIEDFSIDVRDTKLGPEMVTRDIPNVSEERLKDLDEEGIVRIGAEVSSGDILVGKVTLKGESDLSAEEKLLRAIFGEEARDVKDTSLYLQHGEHGKVVDIKIFSRDQGDKLPTGVIKTIQVSVANLRKIQVGDKMAGRHGNKGVISRVVPQEDMPFLEDGTGVDIILSPLGVPSRMNVGQILETHLGWAARDLGYRVASPVLDGVPEEIVRRELLKAGIPPDGKVTLYDGRSGQPFMEKVTVGVIYMMKLNHLVEDKMHQRSIGPYSLVTQQPLGGKAQFGGQRFGEMEVWALEAYGAAYTLQEMLTIKSDDVLGRSKTYESIIKGEEIQQPNIPESFNVLVKELKGLCLNVELVGAEDRESKGSN